MSLDDGSLRAAEREGDRWVVRRWVKQGILLGFRVGVLSRAVAETLFNEVEIDGYFLEYDTDRAGGFEPLRFFPKGKKQLVLGLVTSKSGTLEKKDEIKRRIEEGDAIRRSRPALA